MSLTSQSIDDRGPHLASFHYLQAAQGALLLVNTYLHMGYHVTRSGSHPQAFCNWQLDPFQYPLQNRIGEQRYGLFTRTLLSTTSGGA